MKGDEKLEFQELMDAFNSIYDEVPSNWVIPMSYEERLHYDKHPPSPEMLEILVRKRGAIEFKGHSIHQIRFPDKLMACLRQLPEFKELQRVEV